MENETNKSTNKYLDKPTHSAFTSVYSDFLSIFDVESKEELVNELKENNLAAKQVCAKVLKRGVGAWVCRDCEKDSSCIICNECYEKSKDKHINHKKFFKNQVSGCCDCGDPDSWDPNGFCSDHQGMITSDDEITDLINKTFDASILNRINEVLEELFKLLSNAIRIYEGSKESLYVEMISEVLGYLELLASSNFALMHLIVFYFIKNIPVETTHICFQFHNESKKIEKLEMTKELHACSCSFFQNLIRIWDRKFDGKLKIDKVFYTFLKSYKFKYLFGFSYLSLYDNIMINDSEYLKTFSVQVMTIEDIGEVVVASEEFVTNLFQKLYYLTNYYLDGEESNTVMKIYNHETLFKIIFEFYMDINYLSKPKPAKTLSTYVGIFKILIDVLEILQNRVKFETTTSFQYEGFQENFLSMELYLLQLFSLLTTNFNFTNSKNADEILFYLMDKLRLKKHSQLSDNEYSFHIPLNRALAIFLNRYSFYQCEASNIDLVMAVKNNLDKYFNTTCNSSDSTYTLDNLLKDMISNTIKFIGFINSIQCKYWVYYGDNMLYYHILYYAYDIFYLCDFTLLKLVLSQDHNSSLINFEYFFQTSDVNKSYYEFANRLLDKEDYCDLPSQSLFTKNLDILIRLFRNQYYLVDLLATSYERVTSNKMEDSLLTKVIFNETQAFREFVKIRLIHVILSKSNSIYYSEIIKLLPFYIKDSVKDETIELILNEMCERIVSKNKPVMFSLKNEYLLKSDLYYIINPKSEVNAEKYLVEFKKNEMALLNTPDLNTFALLKILNANFANHFFQNQKSIEICIKTTTLFLNKISRGEINPSLSIVLDFMKLIDIFISVSPNNGYLSKYDEKVYNKELIDCLSSVKTSDGNLQRCAQYLLRKVKSLNKDDRIDNPIVSTSNDVEIGKLKMKEMKEKTAALFKNKTTIFKQNYNTDIISFTKDQSDKDNSSLNNSHTININIDHSNNGIMLIEEDLNNKEHDCIICRNKINSKEFFSKPYGRIGVFSASSFLYHAKLQTLKKEYEQNIYKNKSKQANTNEIVINNIPSSNTHSSDEQLFIKDLMLVYKRTKPEMKKSLRFISCNHYIHFSCYLTLIIKYVIGNSDKSKHFLFICPLCKTMSNTFIPCFDYTNLVKNEESGDILKALTFRELFIFYNEILSQNTNINEVNLNMFQIKKEKFTFDESVIYAVSHFVEKIVSLQIKSSFLINDFKIKVNQIKYYESMKNFFINSVNLLDILRKDDHEMIVDIIKDYIISLRVLIKTNQLDGQIFFSKLLQIQFYWNTEYSNEDNMAYNIDTDKVSSMFLENIFLILILLDESELNYLNIIFRHTIPLILIQFFVLQMFINFNFKIDAERFEKSFVLDNMMFVLMSPEYNKQIKNFLMFYLRKAVMLKSIFKENKKIKTEFKDENIEFSYYCEEIGIKIDEDFKVSVFLEPNENIYPPFWAFKEDIKELTMKLFGKYYSSKVKVYKNNYVDSISYLDTINPSLLLITNDLKFNFISLPSNLLDLSMKYYKTICNNCGTNPSYAILCLVCGEKICYTDVCCKNYGKKKNIYEYIWHNKICGSGDGIFLHLYNGEITLSLLGNFVSTKMSIYLNKFGESLKGKSMSDEYVLNQEYLNNILSEFRNLSYKKYFRINASSYFTVDDEEEM